MVPNQGPMVLKAAIPQGPMVPNQGPMVLKAAIPQGPMVLKPTKPRENVDRTTFIKTVVMLNPDIDYQKAADAYVVYFTPLKDRGRLECQMSPAARRPC